MALLPAVVFGQEKVVIVRHGSTPEGDIIRARADAVLLLRQAELIGEKAYAQRLNNLIRECDVVYKRFSTRNKIGSEALANKFNYTFDIIRFNQQLADVRSELERNAIKQRTRIFPRRVGKSSKRWSVTETFVWRSAQAHLRKA
jgi:hypothetical protein